MDIKKLAKRYDESPGYIVSKAPAPTAESIAFIESKLAIKIPNSLVQFANYSNKYGNWLASLGPNYESETHILRINDYWKNKTETRKLPSNLIVINVGYDQDLDCIDLETYDESRNEYYIVYWSHDVEDKEGCIYDGFYDYMSKMVKFWNGDS